jgi:hypothetical protein
VSGTDTDPSAPPWRAGAAWIDGRYRPVEDARISVLDLGVTRSDCTYDVVHVWEGRFYRLDAHLDRFTESMARLRLDPGLDRAAIESALHGCVRHGGLRAAYVSMTCTRGRMPAGSRDLRTARSMFYCYAVAEELNFTRAAARLGLAQPPLSAAIGKLERKLGVTLLERTSRRVALTPAGAVLSGRGGSRSRRRAPPSSAPAGREPRPAASPLPSSQARAPSYSGRSSSVAPRIRWYPRCTCCSATPAGRPARSARAPPTSRSCVPRSTS